MRRLLLLGTDTDVGKTTIAGALCAAVIAAGRRAVACKPIETGYGGHGDLDAIARIAGPSVACVAGLRFELAAAPGAAARAAGAPAPTVAEAARIVRTAERQGSAPPDAVIVESCGGALTPLNDAEYGIDLARELPEYELVLVAALRLGVLSHTFAICEYARSRGLARPVVVLTERFGPVPPWYRASTLEDVAARGLRVAAVIPHMPALDTAALAAAAAPLL